MKTKRIYAGIAAAALFTVPLAAPGIAFAAPVDWNDHINVDELTSAESGGVTTVTFAPGTIGSGLDCNGPIMYQFDATPDELAAAMSTAEPGYLPSADGQSAFIAPDGLREAVGDELYNLWLGMFNGDRGLADAVLSLVGSNIGGAGNGTEYTTLPSSMQRNAEANVFSYTLDPDTRYIAMGQCGTTIENPDGTLTTENAQLFLRGINQPVVGNASAYKPGQTVSVTINGLLPNHDYGRQGNSTPFCVDESARSDASGQLRFDCTLPSDLETGTHHFNVFDGTKKVASIEFEVASDGTNTNTSLVGTAGSPGDGNGGSDDNGGGNTGSAGSLGSLFGSFGS